MRTCSKGSGEGFGGVDTRDATKRSHDHSPSAAASSPASGPTCSPQRWTATACHSSSVVGAERVLGPSMRRSACRERSSQFLELARIASRSASTSSSLRFGPAGRRRFFSRLMAVAPRPSSSLSLSCASRSKKES